jgi:hypothetical protein
MNIARMQMIGNIYTELGIGYERYFLIVDILSPLCYNPPLF